MLLALTALGLLVLKLVPESRPEINGMLLTWLPYFTFIMYSLNGAPALPGRCL